MGKTRDTWLYDSELAELWRVDPEFIRRICRLGTLASEKGCGCRLIHVDDIAKFEEWNIYMLADARRVWRQRSEAAAVRATQLALDL